MKGKRQDEQEMCIIRSHNSDCSKMGGERETKEIARRKGKQERQRRGDEIEGVREKYETMRKAWGDSEKGDIAGNKLERKKYDFRHSPGRRESIFICFVVHRHLLDKLIRLCCCLTNWTGWADRLELGR